MVTVGREQPRPPKIGASHPKAVPEIVSNWPAAPTGGLIVEIVGINCEFAFDTETTHARVATVTKRPIERGKFTQPPE
jgi:hypothetical protein